MIDVTENSSGTPTPPTDWRVSLLGGLKRDGRWTMQPKTVSISAVGGAHLDLTEALLASNDVLLTVGSVVGGVDVTVPADVNVVVQGVRLLGGHKVDPPTQPTRATLTIRSFSAIGGVRVRRASTPTPA
jgi:hypothetical protein